jgi:hypothetical protein
LRRPIRRRAKQSAALPTEYADGSALRMKMFGEQRTELTTTPGKNHAAWSGVNHLRTASRAPGAILG